jgi:hypothetical protein
MVLPSPLARKASRVTGERAVMSNGSLSGARVHTTVLPAPVVAFYYLLANEILTSSFFLEYADPESDGGLEQDLASRRYRALLPDEEYESDDY